MVTNKKGQELTLGTIVLIVLGVLVLIFLIYGFSTGWSNLWAKIGIIDKSNIETVKTTCQLACSQGSATAFCNEQREVIIENGFKNSSLTCKQLVGKVDFKKGKESIPKEGLVVDCPSLCP